MTDREQATTAYTAVNRAYWDGMADEWVAAARRNWAGEPAWGQWHVPDDQAPLLPADLTGRDVIELGCGTGYVSAWAARRGARRVVGVDNSARQLETAAALASEYALAIEWMHGTAEDVPLGDDSFDVAVSEYGASIWSEPRAWLAEARRLLRPGGRLAFLGNHPLVQVCAPVDGSLPVTERLERPWFGLYRLDWTDAVHDPGGIEFCPTVGEWFRIFAELDILVEDYREIRAPEEVDGQPFAVTADWAQRWPAEHAFWVRMPG